MDEKLEQAAKECADSFILTDFYMGSDIKEAIREAFEAGANWQKEQSPWINVKDKQPLIDEPILALLDGRVSIIIISGFDERENHHPFEYWMPIPNKPIYSPLRT